MRRDWVGLTLALAGAISLASCSSGDEVPGDGLPSNGFERVGGGAGSSDGTKISNTGGRGGSKAGGGGSPGTGGASGNGAGAGAKNRGGSDGSGGGDAIAKGGAGGNAGKGGSTGTAGAGLGGRTAASGGSSGFGGRPTNSGGNTSGSGGRAGGQGGSTTGSGGRPAGQGGDSSASGGRSSGSGGSGASMGGAPGVGGTSSGSGGSTSTTCAGKSGTISDQYGYEMVQNPRDCHEYVLQNNVWGGGNQTITYDIKSALNFKVTAHQGGSSTTPGAYPSLFIGSNNDRATTGSNLPIAVNAIQSVQTNWAWSSNGAQGMYNATYDVWFSNNAKGDQGSPSGAFLMVWFARVGGANPIAASYGANGAPTSSGSATIAGQTWDVYRGMNGVPCISYVARNALSSLSFDLKAFISDAIANAGRYGNSVTNSMYLTNVFAGFEIWNNGVGLQTTDFSVVVK